MSTEHITDTQIVSNVVGAVFGLYLFYTSQMHSKDKLYAVPRIPVPVGESPFLSEDSTDLECRRIAALGLASRTSRHTRYLPTIFDIHPPISP